MSPYVISAWTGLADFVREKANATKKDPNFQSFW